ncbi:MAG: hypothetical protein ACRBM6_23200 [Geminicoccales bacterium]|jgi:membrane protein implicated in regulation of membrane protease activity
MELVGILIAILAAIFVFFHAWIRRVPVWAAFLWALGTFLFLIIILPIYLLIRPKGPERDDDDDRLLS